MIGQPFNDAGCLAQITEVVAELVAMQAPALVELAERFDDTAPLAAWIRSLPQRDDKGDPADGPRAEACDPPQRLRIPAPDPNCVERAAWYVGAAELIDPVPVRQLATVPTPGGLHTFPVEDGVPVVLDPRLPRNALDGGLFQMDPAPVRLTPSQALAWVTGVAEASAHDYHRGPGRVRNAATAVRGLAAGQPLSDQDAVDVVFTLAVAEREARAYGPRGVAIVRCAARALCDLDEQARVTAPGLRNGPELRWGRRRVRPSLGTLGALAKVGGRLGYRAGVAALRAKLAALGVTGVLLHEVERELNREGLSLGEVAKPAPMPGTLAALTTDALAGRWLSRRL